MSERKASRRLFREDCLVGKLVSNALTVPSFFCTELFPLLSLPINIPIAYLKKAGLSS